MSFRFIVMGSIAALALHSAAEAQVLSPHPPKAYQKISVSKAVLGSARIVIWGGAAVDPDCTPHPGSTLTVVEPPAHGQIKVVEEPVFVAFPSANPRSVCNNREVPGRHVYYTANAGFRGHDKVVLEGGSEDGHVRRVTVDVDVRKPVNG